MGRRLLVKVKVFGAPSLALERKELTIELNDNATTDDLLQSLPVKDKDYLYIVREGIRLNSKSKINDGDEILVVPPIAGG
ncbi:MAG: MoaD/ThiS family protein [Candidatus Bathyarchaeia archaeon]|jgi:molybdopterin converting factor small subunit